MALVKPGLCQDVPLDQQDNTAKAAPFSGPTACDTVPTPAQASAQQYTRAAAVSYSHFMCFWRRPTPTRGGQRDLLS